MNVLLILDLAIFSSRAYDRKAFIYFHEIRDIDSSINSFK